MNTSMRRLVLPLLVLSVLLPACGGKHPPSTYPSKGREKASQRPYTVMGKTYEPLKSHVGFSQQGIASWYGRDFHGKKTSNGEIYDMHALTAAHKTLPLGVYVKVENRDNGKEIVVRVNDRGPFVKNRIIDLSYAAAKKLGYDNVGTARVRIEALGYKATDAAGGETYTAPENYETGNFAIQVGSFKDPSNAERLAAEMRKRYGRAEVRVADVNGDKFNRVLVGKYTSLSSAEEAEKDFELEGYPGSFSVSMD